MTARTLYPEVNMPFTFAGEPYECDYCYKQIVSMNMAVITGKGVVHAKCHFSYEVLNG